MSNQHIDDQNLTYALIHFDDNGNERRDDPEGGLFSKTILENAARSQPTNIFLFSHGWKGDVASAIDQYNRWIGAMWKRDADKQEMGAGFSPLFIGLHWPSRPWGDENLGGAASFGVGDETPQPDLDTLFEEAVTHFGGGADVRSSLKVLFEAQKEEPNPLELPADVLVAYQQLAAAVGFSAGGDPSAAPDQEGAALDPQKSMEAARLRGASSFGVFDSVKNGVLSGLRQVSFWLMKNRARQVGESGMHQFVAALQEACPNAAVHLMGHSFGCIVISSILGGPDGKGRLPRPVNSTVLVQGAVSLWAFGDKIKDLDKPGYFNGVLRNSAVSGPLVTTTSVNDSAVGTLYPLAVGLVGQANFADDLPLFGGVGTFGIQGTAGAEARSMLDADGVYSFASGRIYNLEGSSFIPSHNGIDGPQVAHVIWQAARAGVGAGVA